MLCSVPVTDTVYKELEGTELQPAVLRERPTVWAGGTRSLSHKLHSRVACMDFQEFEMLFSVTQDFQVQGARVSKRAEGFGHSDPAGLGR